MNPPQPSNTNHVIRRMGMSLAVLGAVIIASGLVSVCRGTEEHSKSLPVFIIAVGVAMLISGSSIWHGNKSRDPS